MTGRTRMLLRRTLQVLLVLTLILLVLEWGRSPKHGHLQYFAWSTVLAFIVLLLGPWWIDRPKKRDELLERPRHVGMALLIYGLFLATGMPAVSIWAVLWAGMSVYSGVLLAANGNLVTGVVSACIPLLGVIGLYSLWALARYYVRVPRQNPPRRELIRLGMGLCAGLGVVVFIWLVGDIWKWGDMAFSYVVLACLSPLILTLFFLMLMLLNVAYPSRSNA